MLSQISPLDVERHKRDRKAAGVKVRPNREIAVLKRLFYWSIENKLYEGPNPGAGIKLLEEPQKRLRYLEDEEERRLLAVAAEPLKTIILLGIYTGLRIEAEALTLRWDDLDLKRNLLTVQSAYGKNHETRSVPINSVLKEALVSLRSGTHGEYVLCKRDGTSYRSIRTAFETACRHAGLLDVTPHTLRHTFASRLAMKGVDLRTIQELGGWKRIEMVQRYAHLSAKHKAQAVETIIASIPNDIHNAVPVSLAAAS